MPPLLYGTDGRAIVSAAALGEEARDLLVEAFAFVSGISYMRAHDIQEADAIMSAQRADIIQRVVAMEEVHAAIQERYGVLISFDPETQEVRIKTTEGGVTRPPGPPR